MNSLLMNVVQDEIPTQNQPFASADPLLLHKTNRFCTAAINLLKSRPKLNTHQGALSLNSNLLLAPNEHTTYDTSMSAWNTIALIYQRNFKLNPMTTAEEAQRTGLIE